MDKLKRRIRTAGNYEESELFDLIAYGPREIEQASTFGAVEALLTTSTTASAAEAVRSFGGVVHVFDDIQSDDYATLQQLGGSAALLRWSMSGCAQDDSAKSVATSAGSSSTTDKHEKEITFQEVQMSELSAALEAAQLTANVCAVKSLDSLSDDIVEEFEALESIFPSGLPDSVVEFSRVGKDQPECIVVIRSSCMQHSACMRFTLPPNYPEVPANVIITTSRGIGEELLRSLTSSIGEACRQEIGGPSIFAVATHSQELLADLFTAPGG